MTFNICCRGTVDDGFNTPDVPTLTFVKRLPIVK